MQQLLYKKRGLCLYSLSFSPALYYTFSMKRLALFLLVVIYMAVLPQNTQAHASEFKIGIYPPVIPLSTVPGKPVTTSVKVANSTQDTQTLQVKTLPFTPSPKNDGTVVYRPNTLPQPLSAIETLKIEVLEGQQIADTITLEAGETKEVTVRITPPANAPKKDYYYSLLFISKTTENEAVRTSLALASHLLIMVGNPTQPQMSIEQFSSPIFLTQGPVPFTVLLKNNGSHFVQAAATVTIHNMLNLPIAKVKTPTVHVLANSSRFMTDEESLENTLLWNEKYPVGLYKAVLEVDINGQKTFQTQRYILLLPITITLPIILVIVFSISIYLRVLKKLSKTSH